MSQRELTRLEVIQRVKRKTLKQRQAAELLSISVRRVKRLCKAYQASGAVGLISKRRSQPFQGFSILGFWYPGLKLANAFGVFVS